MQKFMLLSYYFSVKNSQDLRKILSDNIRNARNSMSISQAKLAEYAEISVPHMISIEYCKTWVSDKTLDKIARALNMEVFELLTPNRAGAGKDAAGEAPSLSKTVSLINAKKTQLRKKVGEMMDDLVKDMVKLYGEE